MPLFKCSASKAKPKNGIRYITDQNKAAFVSAKNLFEDEDYAKQFEETAKRFGKGEKFDERKYYHFKLSCARRDNVTPRRAHDFAEEVAEAFFKNYECVIATHTDTETVHSHIIVNAVDPITGKKLQFGKAEYAAMKDEQLIRAIYDFAFPTPQKDISCSREIISSSNAMPKSSF